MTHFSKRLAQFYIPTILGGAILVVIATHVFIRSILDNLVISLPEHVGILNSKMYQIDAFVFLVTISTTCIFLLSSSLHLKKLISRDVTKYMLALQSATSHIIITDLDGKVLFANKGAEEMTGYTAEEMKGNTPRLWGALMPQAHYENLWKTIKYDQKSFSAEVKNRRKNQNEYYALMHISPILDEKNHLHGFVSTENDITLQKEADQNYKNAVSAISNVLEDLQFERDIIKQSERKYHKLIDAMREGLAVQDSNGNLSYINNRGCEMLGYTRKEIIGKSVKILFDAENNKILHDQMIKRKKGEHESYKIAWLCKDGSTIDTLVSPNPTFDKQGNFVESIAVFTDIGKEMEIDKAKTEFVSLASHQLRTPLSTVKWYAEMLLAGDAGELSEEQKQYTQEIYHGNQRMVELLDTLLDVSRLELGTFRIEPEDCDFKALYAEVEDDLLGLMADKKITLTTHFTDLPIVQLDKRIVRVIMENLLSNAIKYTPNDGRIDFHLSILKSGDKMNSKIVKEDSVCIVVSDTGYGIPKNQQDRIFTKLFRADNVRIKDTDGTGLGLYIVKSIADKFGGAVWFESEENKGSTFYVTLPLARMKKTA